MTLISKTLTPTQARNRKYALNAMRSFEAEMRDHILQYDNIPGEWFHIEPTIGRRHPTTTRITLRLDADVVKFFKAMGPGYQPRINQVLRSFMHMKLAKLVEDGETGAYVG